MKIVNTKTIPYQIQISILSNSTENKNPRYTVKYESCIFDPIRTEQLNDTQQRHDYIIKTYTLSSVSIEFLNKGANDTVIADDTIVEDLYIQVCSFKVDNFDLSNKLDSISHYKNDAGINKTFGFMSHNGTLTLNTHSNILHTNLITSLIGK